VIRFDPEGIGLVDAVVLTLQYDPNIKLQDVAVQFQDGVAQELTGAFDLAIVGNASYEWRRQELPETLKTTLREQRAAIEQIIAEGEGRRGEAEALLEALERALDAPPGQEGLPDPDLNARLRLIDTLIEAVANPIARQKLRDLRTEYLRDQITRTQGEIEDAINRLEEGKERRESLGEAPDEEIFYNGYFDVELAKLFRSGIFVTPFFDGNVDGTNYKDKPKSADDGGKGIEDLFTFRVGFNVVVPLARGRGSDAVAAGEKAALLDYDASFFSLQFQSSVSVLDTVLAYWNLKAAQDTVDISSRSVLLQERLVELTQALIDAGELAQVEIARVRASEASSRARLDDARRALHEARVNLALVMGLEATDEDTSLPLAMDAFPSLGSEQLEDADVEKLVDIARMRRQDLKAALVLNESAEVLERGAKIDTKPLINAVGGTWYTALGERDIGRALDRWVGPSFSVGVDVEKPFGNNALLGRHAQRRASLQQSLINSSDLQRVIQLAIVRLAISIRDAAERVRQAEQAVQYYQDTIDAEIERFQAGDATLIDTILTEQQQTSALLSLVSARRILAELIAQLRFERGLLVSHTPGESKVTRESLMTLPNGLR
jgi:outer membrane protein TolC